VLEIRRNKFPDLSKEGTAGSFFKNPIVSQTQAVLLTQKYPGMPLFSLPESLEVKVPLGWLLDYRHGVLDMRSVQVGGARLFEKQFLVIVAQKGSSAEDVKALAQIVEEKNSCGVCY
jgi:UDP-N-acetylmuramate dehydrogenase